MAVIEQPVEVSERERLKAEALAWVNDVRAEYNAEPLAELPKGRPGVAWGCVLAEAVCPSDGSAPVPPRPRYLPAGQHHMTFARDGQVQTRPIPDGVAEFAMRFDAGEYPELIA